MKMARLLTLAAVPFVLVACPAERPVDEPWTDPALEPAPPPAPEPVREETVSLDEVAGSGVTGEVEIREVGAQAQVLVRLEDAGPNITYTGGIFRGTCEMPGERVAELPTIETAADGTGQAMATVAIPGWGTAATPQDPATAPAQERLVVAYHRGEEAPTADFQPVTCGELRGDGALRTNY